MLKRCTIVVFLEVDSWQVKKIVQNIQMSFVVILVGMGIVENKQNNI